jgi:hypothetical protein
MESSPNSMEQLFELLETDSLEELVLKVTQIKAENAYLNAMLSSITTATVVLAGGRPLFVQMPPIMPHREYPVDVLEMVRDALVDASASLRGPIAQSKASASKTD